MKRFWIFIIVISSMMHTRTFPQNPGALIFTTFQQSPLLIGAGQTGTAIPNDDALGYYYNPAVLGYSSRDNHISISAMPDKTIWANWGSSEITFHNYGMRIGYNLVNKINLPISVGFGIINNKFEYGEVGITSESSPEIIKKSYPYDQFTSYSIGIGVDYYLRLNAGISLKSFDSRLSGTYTDGRVVEYSADGTMIDYGLLLTIPISDLVIIDENKYIIDSGLKISPVTNFSFGYAVNNIGDEIYYVDKSQKDPLSRTARLAYSFDIGLDLSINSINLNLFNYTFTGEAEDLLIKDIDYENFTGHKYQSGLGDIKFKDNLFLLKSDKDVIVHKGHIFRFLDTFILTAGRILRGEHEYKWETDGIGITSEGFFKVLNMVTENKTIDYITKHFIIEYYDANYDINVNSSMFNSGIVNFDGVSLHFKGFEI